MSPITPEQFRVSRNPTPTVSSNFNDQIDFCIWVLEHDRLQVPPFEHHAQAFGPLQAQGLTPEIWQAWFERGVRSQHSSFLTWAGWYTSREVWVERGVQDWRDMMTRLKQHPEWNDFDLNAVDWTKVRGDCEKIYDADETAARAAAQEAQLSSYIDDLLPSDLFPVPEARELKRSLEALWYQYDNIEYNQRMQRQGYPEWYKAPPPHLSFRDHLKVPLLNVHQVAYEAFVMVSVPSSSIVVSALVELESEAFKSFVLQGFVERP